MHHLPLLIFIFLFTLAGCTPGAPPIATPGIAPTEAAPATTMTTTTVTLTDTLTATIPVTATTTLTGAPPITGTATITAPIGDEVGACTWEAIHNFQPPGPAQLRVSGVCIMPTPGYSLTLTRAEPQGINPNNLLLNLTATAPTGMVAQVLTPTAVVYEETTDQHFDQVDIISQAEMVEGLSVVVQEVN